MDFEPTEIKKEADLIIFNTCCIRENAELKVLGNLGSLKPLKKKKPHMKIVVCGCMMQQPHIVDEIKQKYRHVDLIFGTHNLHNFPYLLNKTYGASNTLVEVWNEEGQVIEGLPVERKIDMKAFVNIMYGCNNFCTYCIVPYTRGRERSRTPEAIIQEITTLVSQGVKEVTLLGQNVNSYGNTLDNPIDFPDLLKMVSDISGLKRIRFMTSHPKDISDKLLETMAACDNVCKYLHLPIQSGSNRILKLMNRHYTKEQYLDIVARARKLMPDLSITTDLIIGFPGETEADNEETMDLIRKVGYDSAFTFMYSSRKGTPAAEMAGHLSEEEKNRRFHEVLNVLNPIAIEKNRNAKDMVFDVLVESHSKTDENILSGRSQYHHVIHLKGDEKLLGKIVRVKITDPKRFSLNAELLEILA
jgi:tRNA-2-methylthio-N6-dimethylallyladenosine synthase